MILTVTLNVREGSHGSLLDAERRGSMQHNENVSFLQLYKLIQGKFEFVHGGLEGLFLGKIGAGKL